MPLGRNQQIIDHRADIAGGFALLGFAQGNDFGLSQKAGDGGAHCVGVFKQLYVEIRRAQQRHGGGMLIIHHAH
mgnify:CR=1 FL=1